LDPAWPKAPIVGWFPDQWTELDGEDSWRGEEKGAREKQKREGIQTGYSDREVDGHSESVSDFLQGINIYLIGMMGAGKTTVGQLLAKQLGYRFFDTDVLIEQVLGQVVEQPKTIAQFFAEQGEQAFRELESHVLSQLAAETCSVISTGGGIVLKQENWGYLQYGVVVWLDVPLEVLQARLQADTTRPLLQDANPKEKLHTLLHQRQSLYAQADVRVMCDRDDPPEAITQRAIDLIQQVIKPTVPTSNGSGV
jgi:shikimate kinase